MAAPLILVQPHLLREARGTARWLLLIAGAALASTCVWAVARDARGLDTLPLPAMLCLPAVLPVRDR